MIEYCVYRKDENVILAGKPMTTLQGSFPEKKNAELFLNAIRKAYPESKNVTYFIDKWDTIKNSFVK